MTSACAAPYCGTGHLNTLNYMEDEVIRGATVVKEGNITLPPPAPRLSAPPNADMSAKTQASVEKAKPTPEFTPQPVKRRFMVIAWLIISQTPLPRLIKARFGKAARA